MALLNSTSSDNLPLDLDPDFCFSMAEFDLEEFSSEDLFQDDSYHNGFLDLSPAICHDDQNLSDLNDSYFSDSKSFQNPDTSRPTLLMPNRGSYSHNFVEESSDTTPTSDEYLSISDSNILEKHPDDFSSELSDRDIKPSYLYSNWEEKSILNANHADNLNHASITNKVFVERRPGLVKHGTSFSRLERLSHNTPQQQPSITISLSNGIGSSTYDNASNTASSTVNNASNNSNLLRSRQQCGVMSGRIKKKDAYFPLIHIKRSPSQSPLPSEDGSYYHDSQQHTSAFHNSSATSLRMRSQGNGQRHYPVTSLSSSTASGNVSLTRTNLLRPISSSNASSNGACFKLGSNYRSDANQMLSSSGMNDNCDASTCSSGSSTRGGNGRGASPSASSLFQNSLCGQSDLLPITEEEIRVMTCEGYPIPSSLPLTKADEKNLKKVRRKIKNKRSAQESRRKKKEYVERLEKHADALAQENIVLRRRLEEMERRVELSEVRNRQLVNRLCKNGNGTTTNNNNNNNPGGNGKCDSSTSANNANNIRSNHLQPHGRTYSPPSSTTATMNSANSTKFYIVAFVLLFSVLFAGDPTILMRGVDSPLGGGAGGIGLRYYSLSRIHKLDAGGFRSFFCPAGIYHCRYGTSKVSNEVAYMRNKKTRWLPRLRHASDESPPGPWKPVVPHATLARVNHSATAKTEPSFDSRRSAAYLPQPFSTKSMLLDAHDVEDGSTECSLSNFWKNLWYSEATVVESSENELWMTDSIRHGAPVVLLNASSLSHFVNIANLSDDTLLLVESKQNVADHANGVIRLLSDSVTFLTA